MSRSPASRRIPHGERELREGEWAREDGECCLKSSLCLLFLARGTLTVHLDPTSHLWKPFDRLKTLWVDQEIRVRPCSQPQQPGKDT